MIVLSEVTLGIDWGTSDSAACISRNGKLDMIPCHEGALAYGKSFPSMFQLQKMVNCCW